MTTAETASAHDRCRRQAPGRPVGHYRLVTRLTQRLINRIRRDFVPNDAAEVISWLGGLTEDAFGRQDPERIQAALVLAAAGDLIRFHQLIKLLRLDWRDVLVVGGLAHGDWPERLRNELRNQNERQ